MLQFGGLVSSLHTGDPNCPGNSQHSSPAWTSSSVNQRAEEHIFSVDSTGIFMPQHQGNWHVPGERPRTEGNTQGALLLLTLEGCARAWWGRLDLFITSFVFLPQQKTKRPWQVKDCSHYPLTSKHRTCKRRKHQGTVPGACQDLCCVAYTT